MASVFTSLKILKYVDGKLLKIYLLKKNVMFVFINMLKVIFEIIIWYFYRRAVTRFRGSTVHGPLKSLSVH